MRRRGASLEAERDDQDRQTRAWAKHRRPFKPASLLGGRACWCHGEPGGRGELMGINAAGKPICVDAISVFRIANGKIAEESTVSDALGLLQQARAVPAPAAA